LKLGSLFDGIGGFPYSAQRHGITPVWASEIEAACISITRRHFPNMKHLGSVTGINGADIEQVEIITFGSPCQDLSVAGKRAGLAGARSGLFGEAIRIIEDMRSATNGEYPTWAIWENVPGALSSNDGLDFKAVLQSFANTEVPMPHTKRWAGAGMVRGGRCDIGWRVLDAQFWGIPQRRRRIFLVADFGGRRAAEILFKPEGLRGHFAPGGTAGKGLAGRAGNGPSPANDNRPVAANDNAVTYDARGNGDGSTVNTLTGDHQNRVTDYTALAVHQNQIGEVRTGDVANTLNTNSNASGRNAPLICVAHGQGNAEICDDLAPSLNCNHEQPYIAGNGPTVRRLTPLECERLQGFPDQWTARGTGGKFISDSARYAAIGNSVAIPCVDYIMGGIVAAINDNLGVL